MYLSKGRPHLTDGHPIEHEMEREGTVESSLRIVLLIGFLFVLAVEGMLLLRIFAI